MKARNLFLLFAISFIALFFGCAKDDFVEVEGVCPIVESTSPTNGEINVALDKTITATFNESMNPATINSSTFIVTENTPAKSTAATTISGTITYSGATASFNPASSLTDNTTYTCTIKTLVKDMAGNALQEDYVWTFSTGRFIPPTVISTFPDDGAIDVDPVDLEITATFSQKMTKTTIEAASTFTVKQGTIDIPGTVSYVDSDSTATFIPTSDLESGKTYTATISADAKNLAGTSMESDYVWTFSTGTILAPTVTSTDPLDLATGVAIDKIISATFSEEMDPLTITDLTFTLMDGTTPITGLVEYSGLIATFIPDIDLLPNTTYEATITTGAMNLGGIALENDYVWTFTTETAPSVTSTDPLDLATGVAVDKIISATFSEEMDPLTITDLTFTLMDGTTPITGLVEYSGLIATFTPDIDLLPNTTYEATITTGAMNLGGIALENDYVWSFTTEAGPILGPGVIDLGLAGDFAILTKTGISTTGATLVTGHIGVTPADRTAITGFSETMDASNEFSTSIYVVGNIYAADYAPPTPTYVGTAMLDQETAFTTANGLTTDVIVDLGAGDISGMTLAPGLYKWSTGLLITNAGVTLAGGPDDTWVFQISDDFTIDADAIITLSGGAQAKNIFWVTATQALLGSNVDFKGNILAQTLISLNTATTVTGRLLSQTAVTLQASIVNKPE